MSYQLYWGDLHSHCSVSYGEGTVEQALARAAAQLDFCSITGHAFWPDMPADRDRYGEIIDYHREGFARLAGNWDELLAQEEEASVAGEFLVLPSYEWHSLEFGDHNVYAPGPTLPLRDAADLPVLQQMMRSAGTIAVPHHIGYAAGYRGIDWRHFKEDASPLVEIFSLHGCSESDAAPYPMLHDMGPRDAQSTAEAGWAAGHRFGVIASTDHHGGYPGSHGEGRVGVFATALTREAIWEALLARRVFAATGDKIDARLWVDDAWIGSVIAASGHRRLKIDVQGCDALDRVEVVKNGRVLRRFFPDQSHATSEIGKYRLRVTWGWGRKNEAVGWDARLSLSDGSLTRVESCFSGQSIVAPQGVAGHTTSSDEDDLPHAITEFGERHCTWRSTTSGNLSTRHATTQAISFELDVSPEAVLTIEVNGHRCDHRLVDLLHSGRSHYLRGWLSEAIRVGPLVSRDECVVRAEFDDPAENDVDLYRLRVAQHNGQWAWLSPIWAER